MPPSWTRRRSTPDRRRHRPLPPPKEGIFGFWTIQRATVTGIAAGLAALIVSALIGGWPGLMLDLYAGLLVLTAFCGASILWITLIDVRNRGRGGRMRPIRAFDIAAASMLILPSLYAFSRIWPELML
jgi:hypothetical protein